MVDEVSTDRILWGRTNRRTGLSTWKTPSYEVIPTSMGSLLSSLPLIMELRFNLGPPMKYVGEAKLLWKALVLRREASRQYGFVVCKGCRHPSCTVVSCVSNMSHIHDRIYIMSEHTINMSFMATSRLLWLVLSSTRYQTRRNIDYAVRSFTQQSKCLEIATCHAAGCHPLPCNQKTG